MSNKQGVLWAAIGALIGAIVALPLGLLDAGTVPLATRLIVSASAGAMAGGSIGFVAADSSRPYPRSGPSDRRDRDLRQAL